MDKHTIKTVENKVADLVGITLPGLLVLDFVFKKGLVHVAPSSWIEFILLLIYAIGLSSPTFIISYFSALPLADSTEDQDKDEEDELKGGFAFYLLPFNLAATVYVIWSFQYFNTTHRFESIAPVGISARSIQLIVAYIAAIAICGPASYFVHLGLKGIASRNRR